MLSRKKGIFSLDFLVPYLGLVVSIITVETFYSNVVRPRADELMLKRRVTMASAKSQPQQGSVNTRGMHDRSVFLIIKDPEPEAEVIFFLWGMIVLAYKLWQVNRERALLKHDFVRVMPGERIIPDEALDRYKELKALVEREPRWRERLLPECLLAALHRFHATSSIQDSANAVKERAELAADHLDSSLGLLRFIAWSIPAIGFIGTVRGIGDALSFVEEALKGDISAVTSWLGLAFNSTLVGLMLCIALMFVLHTVQEMQESFIIEIQTYCRDKLVNVMKVPTKEAVHEVFS
jgi:biopolymer transport protein ExbB/TolQ